MSKWIKVAGIVLATLVVDIGMHMGLAPAPKYTSPESAFVANGSFLPVAAGLLVVTYVVLAAVFTVIQSRLPGSRVRKGLVFGLAFGGLMLVGAPAMSLMFGSPLTAELKVGAVDGLAITLLGVLLGRFTATDGTAGELGLGRLATSGLVVGLVYVAIHLAAYAVVPSLFPSDPGRAAETATWIAVVGVWVGVMNHLLGDAFARGTKVRQAIAFALVGFGAFSIVNVLFAPVFVQAPIGTLLLNACLGIAAAGVGAWAQRVVAPVLQSSARERRAAAA
ncbi:MAG TPA: hypothetical protein VF375_06735 [Candidatus Limnocylindrales bacterium]